MPTFFLLSYRLISNHFSAGSENHQKDPIMRGLKWSLVGGRPTSSAKEYAFVKYDVTTDLSYIEICFSSKAYKLTR